MEELIAKLDAEIAAVLAAVDPLRQQLADAESKLGKLQAGKAALLGQAMPVTRKVLGKTLEMGRKPGSGRPPKWAEPAASALENGPMTLTKLSNYIGLDTSSLIRTLKGEWFTQVNGKGSAYTLTEAGRNRNKGASCSSN